ncbi:MAG: hypothetical protein DWQ02_27355 [Bacteroidetes bacterium]|nr:MAG: hypothetical protein DWQ02_27355 [Bacteroidota bacterium]
MRQFLTLVMCILFTPIWAQSEFRSLEVSFNGAGYLGNVWSLGDDKYYDFSDQISAGVRFRKRFGEGFALRAGFRYDQFNRTMGPGFIWEETFVRHFRMSWGVDYRWKIKFIEPFVFTDFIIQKQRQDISSGGGCLMYYENSEVSKTKYGIAPGLGINIRLGKRFHIGIESTLEFLTGTSEKIYWPFGIDENRTVEHQYLSDVSLDPISGVYLGINF